MADDSRKPSQAGLPPSAHATAVPRGAPEPSAAQSASQIPAYGVKPGVMLGKYKLISLLGGGAMGQVFLAEDPVIRRQVAIKVLHPEMSRDRSLVERLLGEARAAA